MNFLITLLGWLLWNLAEMKIDQDKYLKDGDDNTNFSVQKYARTHAITWIGSFICMFALLIIGYRQLNISPVGLLIGVNTGSGWNDLYLFGAGAAWDGVIFGLKRIKEKLSK